MLGQLGEQAYNGLIFASNIAVSVTLVLANKVLMQGTLGFQFPATLSGLHFLTTASFLQLCQQFGWFGMKPPSARRADANSANFWLQIAFFVFLSIASLVSMNFSLLYNSVGMYQTAKLLIIPCSALIEFSWFKKKYGPLKILSGVVVIAGVAIVTVTDVYTSTFGIVLAASSVLTTSLQQILIGSYQRDHKMTSSEFLALTAPYQTVALLSFGPFLDKYGGKGLWVFDYSWNYYMVSLVLLTCVLALGCNVSQYAALGLFSATTFQIIGHVKTVLLLLSSAVLLDEAISSKKAFGMAVAVVGMIIYGYAGNAPAPQPKTISVKDMQTGLLDEKMPLKDGRPQ